MVNNEKNKYENVILTKQIEDFVGHLSIEKNYALNTISSYKRDLLKFSSFLSKKEVLDFKMIDPDVLNIFVMELRHTNTCLLYTSPSPRDKRQSRMPSSA